MHSEAFSFWKMKMQSQSMSCACVRGRARGRVCVCGWGLLCCRVCVGVVLRDIFNSICHRLSSPLARDIKGKLETFPILLSFKFKHIYLCAGIHICAHLYSFKSLPYWSRCIFENWKKASWIVCGFCVVFSKCLWGKFYIMKIWMWS